jgi:type II secretory pathway component PulC
MKPGDQITALQDNSLTSTAEFRKRMARLGSAEAARLTVVRDGSTRVFDIKPGRGF